MAESQRTLTPAEQRRAAAFAAETERLHSLGYVPRELTVGVAAANAGAFLVMLPFCALALLLYFSVHPEPPREFRVGLMLLFTLLLTVVHELIHGITWAAFAENHWKSIEFGVIWKALTPYCTCASPLTRGQYLLGSAMPTLILGPVLTVIAVLTGQFWLQMVSVCHILGGGGDFLIILKILLDRPWGRVLYCDHPSKLGVVLFEHSN